MNIIDEIRETLHDDDTVHDCIDAYNSGDDETTMFQAMQMVLSVVEQKLLGSAQVDLKCEHPGANATIKILPDAGT